MVKTAVLLYPSSPTVLSSILLVSGGMTVFLFLVFFHSVLFTTLNSTRSI